MDNRHVLSLAVVYNDLCLRNSGGYPRPAEFEHYSLNQLMDPPTYTMDDIWDLDLKIVIGFGQHRFYSF